MRETFEEVGLDLAAHDYLGQLDELAAMTRGRTVGMSIAPHVFSVRSDGPLTLRPNYEVAELVWGSLGKMFRGEIDTTKELTLAGQTRELPAFQVQGHVVWGMTYYMLRSLFQLLGEDARVIEPH
jgi:8-oxo-dGTP pyrophosphatase MutT (NUDIX family)